MPNNPLFNLMGGNPSPNMFGNLPQLIQQFNQFKGSFQGDPQQKVQELLNSGQMTQEQFNQISAMAKQLEPFIPK